MFINSKIYNEMWYFHKVIYYEEVKKNTLL